MEKTSVFSKIFWGLLKSQGLVILVGSLCLGYLIGKHNEFVSIPEAMQWSLMLWMLLHMSFLEARIQWADDLNDGFLQILGTFTSALSEDNQNSETTDVDC